MNMDIVTKFEEMFLRVSHSGSTINPNSIISMLFLDYNNYQTSYEGNQ